MKRFVIIFFVLMLFSSLWSAVLKRYYFKDYGYVTRVVLVFDKKPIFHIFKNDNTFIIKAKNTKKNTSINDFNFKKNKVLKSIKIEKNNLLTITIKAKNGYFGKYFTLYDRGYKLVIDLFYAKNPDKKKILKSYIFFYNSIGYKKRAKRYLQKLKDINLSEKAKKDSIKNDSIIKKEIKPTINESTAILKDTVMILKTKTDSNKISKSQKNFGGPIKKVHKAKIPYILWVLAVGTVVFIIIIALPKRKSDKNKKLEEKTGIWNEDFDENLVVILLKKGWKIPEIAREVNLSEKTIKKIKKRNKKIIKRERI